MNQHSSVGNLSITTDRAKKVRELLAELKSPGIADRINRLDMHSGLELIFENDYKEYYVSQAGNEHYRLLSFISRFFRFESLLDIGTYKGCSALALSYNDENIVHSFDIANHRTLKEAPPNVRFYNSDVSSRAFESLIKTSPFIILDTFHNGDFERHFYNHLIKLSYSGVLMLDDIYLNQPMRDFWDSITNEKYDISSLGHHSGTGIVIFDPAVYGSAEERYGKESYITAHPAPENFWADHPNRWILQAYSKYIYGRVGDIGCNHGGTTFWLSENSDVREIVGIDINENALCVARETFRNVPQASAFISLDLSRPIQSLGLTDGANTSVAGSFDAIVSFHTLEHIYPDDALQFMANIRWLLKRNGFFIISIPYGEAYPDPTHVARFDEESLSNLMLRAGFEVVECFNDQRFDIGGLLTGLFKRI